jgi:hypothetical protein
LAAVLTAACSTEFLAGEEMGELEPGTYACFLLKYLSQLSSVLSLLRGAFPPSCIVDFHIVRQEQLD